MDGDSRGGAALSVREVSGKPIKFVGSGEKLEALELFYPDRIASRILGMGARLPAPFLSPAAVAATSLRRTWAWGRTPPPPPPLSTPARHASPTDAAGWSVKVPHLGSPVLDILC